MPLLRRLVKFTILAALLTIIVSVPTWYYLNPTPPARQVFINGPILTMNANNDIVDAVLIEKDRIVSVGSKEEILAQSGFNAKIIDLEGKTLMPGFIEAHGHFPGSGLDAIAADLNSPPIGHVASINDVKDQLTRQVKETSEGAWIIGFGYDHTRILEQRYMTLEELDTISPNHPLFIMHVSGRISMVNSLALSKLGITDKSPASRDIERNRQGQITGVLRGKEHYLARQQALNLSARRILTLLQNAVEDYTVQGITTVQSGLTQPKLYRLLTTFANLGLIPQRLVIWPDLNLAKAMTRRGKYKATDNSRIVTRALKLTLDGSIPGYTGYLSLPYFKQPPQQTANYHGYQTIPTKELDALVREWHAKGWQIALHASGDAAIDMALAALAKAQEAAPRKNARHIMVHSQMARADQLEEMAQLNITPSFFPSHIYYWGDRYKTLFLGTPRAEQISPLKSAMNNNLRFTIHTDTPVVPAEPFKLIYHATSRETQSGAVLGENEKISVQKALRATTIDAAWQAFLEDDLGSIEPGKLADLIVVSENPLKAGDRLTEITVEQTWIGGVLRYQQGELKK